MSDFDWSNSGSVVLRAYGSLAVYENPHGDIVVRQERDALEEDDSFVVIPVHDAELIAAEIVARANESKAANGKEVPPVGQQTLALPAPTPRQASGYKGEVIGGRAAIPPPDGTNGA